jgi:hypothetical protein
MYITTANYQRYINMSGSSDNGPLEAEVNWSTIVSLWWGSYRAPEGKIKSGAAISITKAKTARLLPLFLHPE